MAANSLISITPPETSLSGSPVFKSVEFCMLERVITGSPVNDSIYGPYK